MSQTGVEFRPLTFPFTKLGWTHELIQRKGAVLLTRRHKKGRQIHFEVIVLRTMPAETFQRGSREISMPCREIYPSSEHWGSSGFTYSPSQCGSLDKALEQAKSKFSALVAHYSGGDK